MRNSQSLVFILAFLLFCQGVRSAEVPSDTIAARLVEEAGLWKGLVSIIGGDPGAQVGVALAKSGDFIVDILEPDESSVSSLRKLVDVNGMYGRSILIEGGKTDPLPYVENSIDLVACVNLSSVSPDLSGESVIRSLRPGGTALMGSIGTNEETVRKNVKWFQEQFGTAPEKIPTEFGVLLKYRKPTLEGVDDWSQWEHGPDNNPLSSDLLTRPPFMTQFLGSPYYIAMPAITTAAGGRTFLAMGHIAHHKREEEWLNTLIARNGYNGLELWRMKLPDGYLVHRSAFIATDDVFYMIDPTEKGVLMLDPETGDEIGRIRHPGHRGNWKWIALSNGMLYGLIGREKDPSETTIVRSTQAHWSWEELSRGYYEKQVPWGFGKTLVAYDVADKELRWKYETENNIDSRAIAIGGGKVFYYGPELHIGAIDADSGLKIWTKNDPEITRLIEEPGRGLSSTPGFRSACYLVYSPDALFFQAQTRMNLVAVSPQDGSLMWRRKKVTNNPNTLYVDGKLYVGIGEEGETLEVNPKTGETLRPMGFGKRSCARLTGTPYQMFCRAQPEGTVFYDRREDKIRYNGAFRPACNDGVIGANGLLYVGPWLCDCNLSLMGSVALVSAGDFNFSVTGEGRLSKGIAYDEPLAKDQGEISDWSTYRGNNHRTAATSVKLNGTVNLMWDYQPEFDFAPTAPVSADGKFFYAGDDGKVRCLNAFTGEVEWVYLTQGPIKAAPTIWGGRVYVGSGDGFVYCLSARSGNLIWKYQAAPIQRKMMVYGHLASTWPVNTGVLVDQGTAYFAAGIIDYDGTYVYALDAETGETKWVNDKTGHLDADSRKGVSAQGFLTIASGKLWMAGGNIVTPAVYDLKTGEYLGKAPGKGTADTNRGEEIGIYGDHTVIQGGRLRYSAAENVVNPGYFVAYPMEGDQGYGPERRLHDGKIPPTWDDSGMYFTDGINRPPTYWADKDLEKYFESGKQSDRPTPKWTATELNDHDTVSLALTGDTLVSVNESPTPRSLFSTWTLSGIDPEDGRVQWKANLNQPALPGGLLVDREGRVLVVHEGGGLSCFGGDRVLKDYINFLVKQIEETPGEKDRITSLLNDALARIHTEGAQKLIIQMMKSNGIVVARKAKENGAITDWHLAGPFPFNSEHPFQEPFVNPSEVKTEDAISMGDRSFEWRDYLTIDDMGEVDLDDIYGKLRNSAVLAYAEMDLDEDRDIVLAVGSNDGFILWLNGEEVGRFEGGRAFSPDHDLLSVKGKKGKNQILMKITNLGSNWGFSVRVMDQSEAPINLAGVH